MITAYDAPTAAMLEAAGTDFILVGDSLGMVLLGYPNTAQVTMDEMIHHAKAVRRGAPKSWVIADLPLKGIQKGPQQTLKSALRFIREAGADIVKIEWGTHCLESVSLMARKGIAVQAHVGLTPQKAKSQKDFKVQGVSAKDAEQIFKQSLALEKAGASLLLLECVPWPLAQKIAENLKIPVIGIGAGSFCDGQVLVFHDLVGLFEGFKPRFVRRYASGAETFRKGIQNYLGDVRLHKFPVPAESFGMDPHELALFSKRIAR